MYMEVAFPPLAHLEQTPPITCMFPFELVRIGILEYKVPSVEASDSPCLHHLEDVLLIKVCHVSRITLSHQE